MVLQNKGAWIPTVRPSRFLEAGNSSSVEGLPPGWLSDAEQQCLAELAKDRDVIEVGTFLGRSTVVMARVAKSVLTIDPHTGSHEVRESSDHSELGHLLRQPDGSYDSLPACIEYLQHFGVRDKVIVVVGRFEDVARRFNMKVFDLAFVDGDHSLASAYHDGMQAMRIARRVVFHDHEATWPGVVEACSRIAVLHKRRVVQLAGALAEIV